MLPLSWCVRSARFGALVGAAFAATGQALVVAVDVGHPELGWIERAGAVAFEAGLVGLATLLAALAARALARGGSPLRRRIAILLATLIVAPVLFGQVLTFVLRGIFGSPLTLGGVEFFLSSTSHIGRALLDGYVAYTAGVALVALFAIGLLAAGLRRAAANAPPPRKLELGILGLSAFVFVASLVARPAVAVERVAQASPTVAFFASLAAANVAEEEAPAEVEQLVAIAMESPPQLAGAVWRKAATVADGPRPNVLLLMLESVGAQRLGSGGRARDVSPNLDRLAAKSRRFSRAWSTATHSNYAQMAILSSLFPRRGSTLDMYQRIDYPRYLFHDLLAEVGYAGASISSQDETWQGMHRFQNTGTRAYTFHALDHQGPTLDTGTERIVPDELTVERAISWIDADKRQPFALYVNLQSTHWPYPIPESAPRPFQPDRPKKPSSYAAWSKDDQEAIENRYDNALRYVDAQVGRLLEALDARGLTKDTLIVVTSDHGELFHEHGLVTHGRSLYEGEARVPLFVHWPEGLPPGDDERPVTTMDVVPTLVEALGLPPFPGHQGESLLVSSPLAGEEKARAIYLNMQGWKHAEAVVCWPWKLIAEEGRSRLFDLSRDPSEAVDRSTEEEVIHRRLDRLLRAQMTAQMRYHAPGSSSRAERYAPRMLRCPDLPRAPHASN